MAAALPKLFKAFLFSKTANSRVNNKEITAVDIWRKYEIVISCSWLSLFEFSLQEKRRGRSTARGLKTDDGIITMTTGQAVYFFAVSQLFKTLKPHDVRCIICVIYSIVLAVSIENNLCFTTS